MEDISCWKEKFEVCCYAKKLLDEIKYLNTIVKNPIDIEEIEKGIYYARKYHGAQMRQSGDPYYSHPIEVAYMVAKFTANEVPALYKSYMINVSLLHDTIEDTDLTEEIIAQIFDKTTANGVEGLTRIKPSGKISAKESLNLLVQQGKYDIGLIKIFDRIHNVQTLGAKSPEKAWKILMETISTFVTLSIYLEIPALEEKLCKLCLDHLNQHNFVLQNQKNIVIDNSLLPSLTL